MKRIVTCSDGTWNKPNSSDDGRPVRTNVQKIFNLICKSDPDGIVQIKYYDAGVGAEGNVVTRMLDGATGNGIDENIQDAYEFISWNYEPGDELYLFGFSRGAYTARSLGGMIRKCGILKGNNLNLLNDAYELYRNKKVGPKDDPARNFRANNCYDVSRIKLIGVWDTVGARGIPIRWFQWYNQKHYAFYDTALSSIVEHAYHAIAVDEKRKTFEPTLWKKSGNETDHGFKQVLEQVWFAGVHSNVGGGYPDEGLADLALKWMIEKAEKAGLAFDTDGLKADVKGNHCGEKYESVSGIFKLFPTLVRSIKAGAVHQSVHDRIRDDKGYRPRNVLEKF